MEEQRKMFCKGLILVLIITAALAIKEMTPIESLKCYNDYDKTLSCTWSERREAFSIIPMKLYHWRDYINNSQPAPIECKEVDSMNSSSLVEWTCHKEVDVFMIAAKDMFMFKPERQLEVKAQVDIYKNIKPQPPLNLSVTMEMNGDFMLTWETAYGNHTILHGQLQAEVSYKRDWEPWEDAHSILLSKDIKHFQLKKSALVPGSRYAARVRLKPHSRSNFKGQWSSWNSEVTWQTPKDDVKPKNLQCTFDGIDQLECFWEVRREVTESILFVLNYTDETKNSSRETECIPTHVKENRKIIHYHCVLNITNASNLNNYQIVIQPKETVKTIRPSFHIKFKSPYNLSVQSNPEDENYKLTWETINILDVIDREFEILYKKLEDPWEAAKLLTLEYATTKYFFGEKELEFPSVYVAKIRMKVKKKGDYNGVWSDWSPEVQWETQKEFKLWVLIVIFIPAIAIATVLALYYGYARFKSAKSNWDDSIPDPRKSKLWGNIQRGPLLKLYSNSLDLFNISLVKTVEGSDIPVLITAGQFDNYLIKHEVCQSNENSSYRSSEQIKPYPELTLTKTKEFGHTCSLVCSAVGNACSLSKEVSSADNTDSLHASTRRSEVDHLPLHFPSTYLNGSYLACHLLRAQSNFISDIQTEEQRDDAKANITGYTTFPQYCSESMPLPESHSSEAQLPSFTDYLETPLQANVTCPSSAECSASTKHSQHNKYEGNGNKHQLSSDEQSQNDNNQGQTSADNPLTDRSNATVCHQFINSNYVASMNETACLPDEMFTTLPPTINGYIMTMPDQEFHSTQHFPSEDCPNKEKKQPVSSEGHPFPNSPDYILSDESSGDSTCYGSTNDPVCAVTEKSPTKPISKDILVDEPLNIASEDSDKEKSSDNIRIHNANDVMCVTSITSSLQSAQQRKNGTENISSVGLQAGPSNVILLHPSGDYCIAAKSHNCTSVTPQQEHFTELGDITAREDLSFRQKEIIMTPEEENMQADQVKTRHAEAVQNCTAISDYVLLPYKYNQESHFI
ncbi:cytokine receptor common subunit beta isoform X2 [Protopterus annectens]|uniref:cytokine receptor common subunit beta isoform X2 n=1 Tax=Protopterus annectens TaxID=7888 RepID=UPI001CFB883F|nr:cytokine receptor common subunit beta isoform X2 [Protopterus annectens]